MKEVDIWLEQFQKIREDRFDPWDTLLSTFKNKKNEQ